MNSRAKLRGAFCSHVRTTTIYSVTGVLIGFILGIATLVILLGAWFWED